MFIGSNRPLKLGQRCVIDLSHAQLAHDQIPCKGYAVLPSTLSSRKFANLQDASYNTTFTPPYIYPRLISCSGVQVLTSTWDRIWHELNGSLIIALEGFREVHDIPLAGGMSSWSQLSKHLPCCVKPKPKMIEERQESCSWRPQRLKLVKQRWYQRVRVELSQKVNMSTVQWMWQIQNSIHVAYNIIHEGSWRVAFETIWNSFILEHSKRAVCKRTIFSRSNACFERKRTRDFIWEGSNRGNGMSPGKTRAMPFHASVAAHDNKAFCRV